MNCKSIYSDKPNPVDVYVGGRVRMRRENLKMSQKQLAANLGVTFQQLQKYERGTNRISASRLWDICQVLQTTAEYFFLGMDDCVQCRSPMMAKQNFDRTEKREVKFDDPMQKQETRQLVKAIEKIGNDKVAEMLTALMKDMASCR